MRAAAFAENPSSLYYCAAFTVIEKLKPAMRSSLQIFSALLALRCLAGEALPPPVIAPGDLPRGAVRVEIFEHA